MSFLKRYKVLILIVAVLLIGVGWYAFRPERALANKTVSDAMPSELQGQTAKPLYSGQFSDGVHPASGTASVYKTADGKMILRLTDLKTSEGPDVHIVFAPANQSALQSKKPGSGLKYEEVALLKGNLGDQNYEIPAGLDVAHNNAVGIYCVRFSAVFGSAPLQQE